MGSFNRCPNCKKTVGGFFGGSYFDIYECDKCKTYYCYSCNSDRCPDCGSKDRSKAGKVD